MNYVIRPFQPETDVLKPFDCGNADLNGFLFETSSYAVNATCYGQEHLAVTYVVEDVISHDILAYFSLLYDKIERAMADPAIWKRLSRKVPFAKRRSSYPGLKIGRLAVSKKAQGLGLGTDILLFIKGWFFKDPKAGCRYLTVDSLPSAEYFYTKCDFQPLVNKTHTDETVLMYFDLKRVG